MYQKYRPAWTIVHIILSLDFQFYHGVAWGILLSFLDKRDSQPLELIKYLTTQTNKFYFITKYSKMKLQEITSSNQKIFPNSNICSREKKIKKLILDNKTIKISIDIFPIDLFNSFEFKIIFTSLL